MYIVVYTYDIKGFAGEEVYHCAETMEDAENYIKSYVEDARPYLWIYKCEAGSAPAIVKRGEIDYISCEDLD